MIRSLVFAAGLVLVSAAASFSRLDAASNPTFVPGSLRENDGSAPSLEPPAQQGDPTYWQVDTGIQLFHFAYGKGRNILIVHGGPGVPFRMPMTGLQPLCDAYRFQYYDERGSGDSSRPIDKFDSADEPGNYLRLISSLGIGAQIADIERIRKILGEDKLIIIGHSWGGFLSALYAAEFPDHVEKLILVSPAALLSIQPKSCSYYEHLRSFLPEEEKKDFDRFLQEYFDLSGLFSRCDDDLVALNERMSDYIIRAMGPSAFMPGRSGGWMIWAMFSSLGDRHDYRAALSKVSAPTLVLCGDKDYMTESSMHEYAEAIPEAEFVVIDGATHFAYEEQPERFATLVADFLARK